MPLPSSTTSLVAGGGDDLDDDDRLSFALTAAASPSSSATSSSKSAPSRGSLGLDPDLPVSGSADGLGALSASSVHLGALRQLGMLQCPDNALTDRNGTLRIRWRARFYGVHLAIPPPPNPYRQAEGIPAFGRLCQSKIFHGGAFDARGNYLRHASPWLKTHLVECSYILDSVVADWLLPRTPNPSQTSPTRIFALNWFRLNETVQLSENLTTLILCGGILIGSDFPPLIRRLAALQNVLELHWVLVSWIGLATRSHSKAGSIFEYTRDSVRQHLLKLSLNAPFNASQFSLCIDLKGFNMKAEPLVSFVGLCRATPHRVARPRNYCSLASVHRTSSLPNYFKVFNVGWIYNNYLRPSDHRKVLLLLHHNLRSISVQFSKTPAISDLNSLPVSTESTTRFRDWDAINRSFTGMSSIEHPEYVHKVEDTGTESQKHREILIWNVGLAGAEPSSNGRTKSPRPSHVDSAVPRLPHKYCVSRSKTRGDAVPQSYKHILVGSQRIVRHQFGVSEQCQILRLSVQDSRGRFLTKSGECTGFRSERDLTYLPVDSCDSTLGGVGRRQQIVPGSIRRVRGKGAALEVFGVQCTDAAKRARGSE
ncbi:hypothetical protein C8R43DRAFT_1115031 [Mycena crocata]|nr:hypothetical protein C8R43DRAFT_1115031 [Mycena crocata]